MIELRLLGALDLKTADGRELRSLLAQPRRVALLACLALRAAGGFCRRDTLLAMFWPELDENHARRALRQALYIIRRELGEGGLRSRGDEEVGLDAGAVWCDVVAFERAVEAGSLGEALDCYRGDLLEGFFISGAPEFEHWLERERGRLRQRAAAVAWQLAAEQAQAGQTARAAAVARQALQLSPDDESGLRCLILLLERGGDRAGALRTYEEFARHLAREYGAEPSAETRALIEAIRADRGVAATAEDSGALQPAAPRAAATPVAAPDHAALPLRPPRRLHWSRLARSLAWTGRARTLAGAALALLLLASVAVWRYGSLGPRAGAPVTRVAVFPFSLRGSPELDYLREGVAELLSTSLDGAGQMVTVDARALLSLLSREKGVPGPDRARELAARLGAGSLVLGSIIEAGGRLELTASLHGRDGTVETVARAGTSREEGIFDVVDQLARGLVAGEYAGPRGRLTRLATLTTPSLPALKAYLAGESALRPGRFAQAAEAFQRAVAADTLFALGYYRLAVAAGWAADFALAQQAAERATRLAHRLSPRDRQLLTAYLAVRRGRSDEAENLYRDILRVYPDDVEAWYLLGETLFHYGRFRGRPAAQARPVFERALALDPEHGGSLAHLMDLAAMQGRFASYDSLLARSFSEGTPPVWRRAVRGFGLGDAQAREKLLAELRRTADQHVALSSRLVATQAHDLEGARQIARLLIEPTRAPQTRARGHFFLAQIELALGRWHAAWKQLDGAEELDHASALELRALYAALPFLPIPRREIERARDRLLHWNAAAVPPQPGSFYATHDGLHPVFRLYLLALLSLRLDDPTAAADFAAEIPRAAARGDSLHSSMLARSVQAQLAWRRGRPLQALAELSSSRPETWEENLGRSPFFSQAHERYLQAEILAELGRDQEALGGFESLAEHAVHELVYLPVAHLRRAEIHERNRQQQAAAQHYAHFLKLWEHCDPELLPLVAAARRRLAARGE